MKEKVLIFIPYQDSDNFYSDGILTREYAILYLLWSNGYKKIINIKKPRTWLDKKRYLIHDEYYPEGTIEAVVKSLLDESETIQYVSPISCNQIINRRCWWNYGYKKVENKINIDKNNEYLVYSDNPYAVNLLDYLSQKNCKIFFDVMDNFAIHPSLNKAEHKVALENYTEIFKFADCISANSQQTCEFMKKYTNKQIILAKNGVFKDNTAKDNLSIDEVKIIREKKKKYRISVGYIGKLGLRLDAELIDKVSSKCKDTLFVFVGGYLKGQINEQLINIFETRENVLHLDAVPSAYVYPILDEFDILSIPHSVGKNENGGDPLKLYQYLTRKKPIITTSILGVNEFKDEIMISDSYCEWIDFINKPIQKEVGEFGHVIEWSYRMEKIIKKLMN